MDCKEKLSGVFIPLTTPFASEKIVFSLLAENIKRYNDTQLKGYMILGGNGEYLGLTEEESLKIINTVVKNMEGSKTVVVGAGRESAYATLEFIKKAADNGAELASIITPFYYVNLMNDEALIRYYTKIAEQSPLPLIIYNSPAYAAGVTISTKIVSELSQHTNIVSMKNSSSESIKRYIGSISSGSTFSIHVGRVARLYEGMSEGAVGATLSIANYLPELCCEAFQSFTSGNTEKSKELCDKLGRINKAVSPNGVPGVKYAMSLMGISGGETRLPLLPLNREKQALIDGCLHEEGLYKI